MAEPIMSSTRRLGEFVARCVAGAISGDVLDKAAICLLDAVGLALLARDERTYLAMRALITPMDGREETARIWAEVPAPSCPRP